MVTKKHHVEYPGVSVLGLKIVTNFCGVSRGEALFCLKFPGVKKKT